jgi:hypothetical protein
VFEDNVPCKICGDLKGLSGTKLCNGCWEVTARLDDFLKTINGRRYAMERLLAVVEDQYDSLLKEVVVKLEPIAEIDGLHNRCIRMLEKRSRGTDEEG